MSGLVAAVALGPEIEDALAQSKHDVEEGIVRILMTYDRDPIETSRRRSTHCLELGVGGAGSVPDYLEIGEAQFAELTEEIRSVVPRILELEELESAS